MGVTAVVQETSRWERVVMSMESEMRGSVFTGRTCHHLVRPSALDLIRTFDEVGG